MKIMFVCTGNICRSAMAKGILEKRAQELNKKEIQVYSCGTLAENGEGATYNAIEAVAKQDINIRNHRATNIKEVNLEEMDLILCMSESHKYSICQAYPQGKEKVFTLKEYVGYQSKERDYSIMDPWGYDMTIYRHCAEEISICIELLLQKMYQLY